MSCPFSPVSPTFPTTTTAEVGRVASRRAEGEEGVEATTDEATGVEGPEQVEVQPHRPAASPEQPTASQLAEHDLTHLNYRALVPGVRRGLRTGDGAPLIRRAAAFHSFLLMIAS